MLHTQSTNENALQLDDPCYALSVSSVKNYELIQQSQSNTLEKENKVSQKFVPVDRFKREGEGNLIQ